MGALRNYIYRLTSLFIFIYFFQTVTLRSTFSLGSVSLCDKHDTRALNCYVL